MDPQRRAPPEGGATCWALIAVENQVVPPSTKGTARRRCNSLDSYVWGNRRAAPLNEGHRPKAVQLGGLDGFDNRGSEIPQRRAPPEGGATLRDVHQVVADVVPSTKGTARRRCNRYPKTQRHTWEVSRPGEHSGFCHAKMCTSPCFLTVDLPKPLLRKVSQPARGARPKPDTPTPRGFTPRRNQYRWSLRADALTT